METKYKQKLDVLWIGLIAGIIMPLIGFYLFYSFNEDRFYSFNNFIAFVVKSKQYAQMISICAVPNLIAFFGFLQIDCLRAGRGVMLITLIMALLVMFMKLF